MVLVSLAKDESSSPVRLGDDRHMLIDVVTLRQVVELAASLKPMRLRCAVTPPAPKGARRQIPSRPRCGRSAWSRHDSIRVVSRVVLVSVAAV